MLSLIELKVQSEEITTVEFEPFEPSQTIATLIGSSDYQAISDDALKDEDNAGWILQLENSIRQEWIERIRWIRLVDRLAECELVCSRKSEFQLFLAGWQKLVRTGIVETLSPYSSVLQEIRDRWFNGKGQPVQHAMIQAWHQYLLAIDRYHTPNLVIETCQDYEQMLTHLAGSFFQILPDLPAHHREAACYFGVVDQFFNHLRDLQEDTNQGLCYLPIELLDRFGVTRVELLQQLAPFNPNYRKMMQFWLNNFLPKLRYKVWQLRTADDLPFCWQVLSEWSLQRYRRIEQVFRECQFDYRRFPDVYWQRVRNELPTMLKRVHTLKTQTRSPTAFNTDYAYRRGWQTEISFDVFFLQAGRSSVPHQRFNFSP
jgi:phytoene synthase